MKRPLEEFGRAQLRGGSVNFFVRMGQPDIANSFQSFEQGCLGKIEAQNLPKFRGSEEAGFDCKRLVVTQTDSLQFDGLPMPEKRESRGDFVVNLTASRGHNLRADPEMARTHLLGEALQLIELDPGRACIRTGRPPALQQTVVHQMSQGMARCHQAHAEDLRKFPLRRYHVPNFEFSTFNFPPDCAFDHEIEWHVFRTLIPYAAIHHKPPIHLRMRSDHTGILPLLPFGGERVTDLPPCIALRYSRDRRPSRISPRVHARLLFLVHWPVQGRRGSIENVDSCPVVLPVIRISLERAPYPPQTRQLPKHDKSS